MGDSTSDSLENRSDKEKANEEEQFKKPARVMRDDNEKKR
jgi:hypothetical protein